MLKTFVSGIKMYLDKVVTQLRDEVGWKNDDRTLLFTETVTAEEDEDQGIATFDYGEPITADTITVTLNGKEYVCPVSVDGNSRTYGAHYDSENMSFNFSEIPFAIDSNESGSNTFYVNKPGTYTVSVTAGAITYTDTFTNAVNDIAGWKAKELKELLSETVTTELDTVSSSAAFAKLSYSDPITADTIIVTFDDTEYVCQKDAVMDQNYYGDSSYTNPPFRIQSNQTEPYRNYVVTKAAGEHTVSIGVEVDACTDDFAKVVNDVAGWKTEGTEQLFSETVTTASTGTGYNVKTLTYNKPITADTLTVTFNDTEYTLTATFNTRTGHYEYGSSDYGECPFYLISSDDGTNLLRTQSAGTYTISASVKTVTTTDTFNKAVNDIAGWKTTGEVTLFDGSVTTTAQGNLFGGSLAYRELITSDTLKVTFNGVEYTCPKISQGNNNLYGGTGETGPDFTEFPFTIISESGYNQVYTETAGAYTISAVGEGTIYTDEFEKAVKSFTGAVEITGSDAADMADIAIVTIPDDMSIEVKMCTISANGNGFDTNNEVLYNGTYIFYKGDTRSYIDNEYAFVCGDLRLDYLDRSSAWAISRQEWIEFSTSDDKAYIHNKATFYPIAANQIKFYRIGLPTV